MRDEILLCNEVIWQLNYYDMTNPAEIQSHYRNGLLYYFCMLYEFISTFRYIAESCHGNPTQSY